MNLKSLLTPLAKAALVALCAGSGAAQATLTVYISHADFMAALSSSGLDSFDDLDPTQSLGTPLNRTAGSYGYSASVGPSGGFWPAGTLGGDAWLSASQPTDSISFSAFSGGVNAVGGNFFGNDLYGDVTPTQTIRVSASDADGNKTISVLNPGKNAFLGFVSNGAISSLQVWVGVQGSGETDVWPAINNLTLGSVAAVPEPQTYALMLGGLGLLGFMARRKKQA